MTLGEKIRSFIDQKWTTMYDAADDLGIKREQLYPYFDDKVKPGAQFLSLLRKFGCDMNWLLDEEGGLVKEPKAIYNSNTEVQRLREEIKGLKKIISIIEKTIEQAKGK